MTAMRNGIRSRSNGVRQRLIDDVQEAIAEIGAVGEQLNHQHADEPRLRIDAIHRTVRTAPAERSDRVHAVGAVAIGRLESKSEAEAARRVQRTDLVRRHEFNGAWRENADAVEGAAVADHLEKARVIARGGKQARAARETLARTVDVR